MSAKDGISLLSIAVYIYRHHKVKKISFPLVKNELDKKEMTSTR